MRGHFISVIVIDTMIDTPYSIIPSYNICKSADHRASRIEADHRSTESMPQRPHTTHSSEAGNQKYDARVYSYSQFAGTSHPSELSPTSHSHQLQVGPCTGEHGSCARPFVCCCSCPFEANLDQCMHRQLLFETTPESPSSIPCPSPLVVLPRRPLEGFEVLVEVA